MKTVVIMNDDPVLGPVRPDYSHSYARIAEAFSEKGLAVARATSWDWASGVFAEAHGWTGAEWKPVRSVRPDAVWYKDSRVNVRTWRAWEALGNRFVNPLPFVLLARDKYAVARELPEYCPRTVSLREAAQNPSAMAGILGERVILKPRCEFGGKGVEAVARSGVEAAAKSLGTAARDWVVQEMVDCSRGIPGIAEGRHDLRAFFVGRELSHWCVRTAPSGDFRANVAAGGSTYDFLPGERPVPAALESMAREVAARVGPADGIWSADMMLDRSGRAALGEITDSPGVDVNSDDPARRILLERRLYGAVAGLFARLAK